MRERKLKISESKSTKQTDSFENLATKQYLKSTFGSLSQIRPTEIGDVYSARKKQIMSQRFLNSKLARMKSGEFNIEASHKILHTNQGPGISNRQSMDLLNIDLHGLGITIQGSSKNIGFSQQRIKGNSVSKDDRLFKNNAYLLKLLEENYTTMPASNQQHVSLQYTNSSGGEDHYQMEILKNSNRAAKETIKSLALSNEPFLKNSNSSKKIEIQSDQRHQMVHKNDPKSQFQFPPSLPKTLMTSQIQIEEQNFKETMKHSPTQIENQEAALIQAFESQQQAYNAQTKQFKLDTNVQETTMAIAPKKEYEDEVMSTTQLLDQIGPYSKFSSLTGTGQGLTPKQAAELLGKSARSRDKINTLSVSESKSSNVDSRVTAKQIQAVQVDNILVIDKKPLNEQIQLSQMRHNRAQTAHKNYHKFREVDKMRGTFKFLPMDQRAKMQSSQRINNYNFGETSKIYKRTQSACRYQKDKSTGDMSKRPTWMRSLDPESRAGYSQQRAKSATKNPLIDKLSKKLLQQKGYTRVSQCLEHQPYEQKTKVSEQNLKMSKSQNFFYAPQINSPSPKPPSPKPPSPVNILHTDSHTLLQKHHIEGSFSNHFNKNQEVTSKVIENSLSGAHVKQQQMRKQKTLENLFEIENNIDQKQKSKDMFNLYVLQTREYLSNQRRDNQKRLRENDNKDKIQSVLEKRGLIDGEFLEKNYENELAPHILIMPVTMAERQEDEFSIDHIFVKATNAMLDKQYATAFEQFKQCEKFFKDFKRIYKEKTPFSQESSKGSNQVQRNLADEGFVRKKMDSESCCSHAPASPDHKSKLLRDDNSQNDTIKTDSSLAHSDHAIVIETEYSINNPRLKFEQKDQTEPSANENAFEQLLKNNLKSSQNYNTSYALNSKVAEKPDSNKEGSKNILSHLAVRSSSSLKPNQKTSANKKSEKTTQSAKLDNELAHHEKIYQMAILNKGVCLFKSAKYEDALKLWNILDHKLAHNECKFAFALLFNQCLTNCILKKYEVAIEGCQELITKICLAIYEYGQDFEKEIQAFGQKNIFEKCLMIISQLKSQIGQPNEGNSRQQTQLIQFRSILLDDMKEWIRQSFEQRPTIIEQFKSIEMNKKISKTLQEQKKRAKDFELDIEELNINPTNLLTDLQPVHMMSKSEFNIHQEVVSPTNLYGLTRVFDSEHQKKEADNPNGFASLSSSQSVTLPFTNFKKSQSSNKLKKTMSDKISMNQESSKSRPRFKGTKSLDKVNQEIDKIKQEKFMKSVQTKSKVKIEDTTPNTKPQKVIITNISMIRKKQTEPLQLSKDSKEPLSRLTSANQHTSSNQFMISNKRAMLRTNERSDDISHIFESSTNALSDNNQLPYNEIFPQRHAMIEAQRIKEEEKRQKPSMKEQLFKRLNTMTVKQQQKKKAVREAHQKAQEVQEKIQEQREQEWLRNYYKNMVKFKIKNQVTDSKLQEIADQIEKIERRKRQDGGVIEQSESQKDEKQRNLIIQSLKAFIRNYEQGQKIRGGDTDSIKFDDLPGNDIKEQWKHKKMFCPAIQNQDHEFVDKDVESLVQKEVVQKTIKELAKFQKEKANWYRNKAVIMERMKEYFKLQKQLQMESQDEQKKQLPSPIDSKYAKVWKRVYKKIKNLVLQEEVARTRIRVENIEKKRIQRILDSMIYEEGKHFVQTLPQSTMPKDDVELKRFYASNLKELKSFDYKVTHIIEIEQMHQQQFEKNMETRIEEAIQKKMAEPGYQQHGLIEGQKPKKDIQIISPAPEKAEVTQEKMLQSLKENALQQSNTTYKKMTFRNTVTSIKPPKAKQGLEIDEATNHESFKRRLRLFEAERVYEYMETFKKKKIPINFKDIDKYLVRFPFFAKYPEPVRKQLLQFGQLINYKKGDIIFRQGDPSPNIYFIFRGTVVFQVNKEDMGYQPVFIKVYYDGQEFGEQNNYKASQDLTPEEIKKMNQQQCTAFANEQAYIFTFSKQVILGIMENGIQTEFERVIIFLKKLDIFKDQDMRVILPIANSAKWQRYSLGQYILKEGEVPQGLYIIVKGQCKVGCEKLNVRSTKKVEYFKHLSPARKPITLKGDFCDQKRDSQANKDRTMIKSGSEKQPISVENYNKLMSQKKRMMFYEMQHRDDNGVVIEDHLVYKDLMIFFNLLEKDIFGGRVMVTKTLSNQEGGKDTTKEQKSKLDSNFITSRFNSLNNSPAQKTPEQSETPSPTLRQSPKKNNIILHEPSQLSVLADSADVELLLIDKTNMNLFPEDVQKLLNNRLSTIFSAERPFDPEILMFCQNKFKEWDNFKIQSFMHQLKGQFNIRQENLIKEKGFIPRH